MKRYKIEYFSGDKSRPIYFTEISKSGRRNGVQISFLSDGRKSWQFKLKNRMISGIDKVWFKKSGMNKEFNNWKKKNKLQGIQIEFHT